MDGVSSRDAQRASNLFALGLVSWLYDRPTEMTEAWIGASSSTSPAAGGQPRRLPAGWNFGETSELIDVQYRVDGDRRRARHATARSTGRRRLALGLIAASVKSGLQLVLASYPITPASELLHELARHRAVGVRTVQAEDEIAAAGIALGAAFGGALGVTATSGPGMDLKAETIGLALMLELPLVVVDVQRAGPSTGMPTKTEQSDLLMAVHGRHGESPLPVIAAVHARPLLRRRLRGRAHRDPLPDAGDPAHGPLPGQLVRAVAAARRRRARADRPGLRRGRRRAVPALRRDEDGARPWAIPGTPGLEHRIGGLEKQDGTGDISYDGATTRG